MLTTISHPSMATEFSVILAESDQHLVEPALEALELLDSIEADLSVYHPGSEISRVNAQAFQSPVVTSPATFDLLVRSVQWSEKTAGAFDITAGPLVRAWGFTQRRGRKPTVLEIEKALATVGYQKIELNQHDYSIRFLVDQMEINLGAIGKGFALDRLTSELCGRGLANFMIHGGGSSIIARGNQSEDTQGWLVGLSHPTKSRHRLAGFRLVDEALSTSGSGQQFFHFRGKRYGHVIDPRTGYPAGDLLSLTAIAENATDAEACSTAYFVSGSDRIREVLDEAAFDLPKMIGVKSIRRQDDVEVLPFDEIDWVDPPSRVGDCDEAL